MLNVNANANERKQNRCPYFVQQNPKQWTIYMLHLNANGFLPSILFNNSTQKDDILTNERECENKVLSCRVSLFTSNSFRLVCVFFLSFSRRNVCISIVLFIRFNCLNIKNVSHFTFRYCINTLEALRWPTSMKNVNTQTIGKPKIEWTNNIQWRNGNAKENLSNKSDICTIRIQYVCIFGPICCWQNDTNKDHQTNRWFDNHHPLWL